MHIDTATYEDVTELSAVAAATFGLACPPSAAPEDIAAHVAANLSADRFIEYLSDPDRVVLIARTTRILGYTMLIRGVPDDADIQLAVTPRPAVELSKMYALTHTHGTGVSAALMTEALQRSHALGAAAVWLGVNQQNQRAQRFYRKHGFTVSGTKTFRLGDSIEYDYVMVRAF